MQRGLTTVGAPRLLFKSVAARSRGTLRSESQIRNDIANLEPLRWLLKSQFDRNVVVNFEIQELMFDSATSELALMLDACERGREPGGVLPPASVPAEVHWSQYTLPHRAAPHSYTATDYHQELEKWRSAEFYEQEVHRMQLPFSAKVLGSVVIVEEMQERRAQQLHRLQEINARRREEMLQQDQERLDKLLAPQVTMVSRPAVDSWHWSTSLAGRAGSSGRTTRKRAYLPGREWKKESGGGTDMRIGQSTILSLILSSFNFSHLLSLHPFHTLFNVPPLMPPPRMQGETN
uniref:Actin related protein 5 n=1 Tax=Hucho hucho TaxID=62062 RepID=A0A4W5LWV6_9TELE